MQESTMASVVFLSHAKTLIIPYKTFQHQMVSGGVVANRFETNQIEFKDSRLTTSDPKVIDFLRHHAGLNNYFWELRAAKKDDPPTEDGITDVADIKTKNEAIAYLVQEKNASIEDLQGKRAGEVAQWALEVHKIKFVDWKTLQ
jgi:hypothetical protein